jgi:hypothetical protein
MQMRNRNFRRGFVHVSGMFLLVVQVAAMSSAETLPHNIPDFTTDTSRPNVHSLQSGNWSSPSTWVGGQVPTANHVAIIDATHVVTIADTSAVAYTIGVNGTLRFSPTVNTRLRVTNLMVMGNHGMTGMPVGYMEIGTSASPIASNVTAEVVFANTPLGASVSDPEQFGNGLINLGKLQIHGTVRTPTFLRLSTEPRVGDTTLKLEQAVSQWQAGDRLVIPDTRHITTDEVTGTGWINAQNQWEELSVQSISSDGKTAFLTAALRFNHLGARDLNGVLELLPHVGNLTRNVILRSESSTGTRGHFISVHTADSDVRYALFRDMGRTRYVPLDTTTNLIGRYPIHMHHNMGPATTPSNGYQFTLIGNAVDGGSVETQFKWGIAVHDSHFGLIQHNVVYNYNGASILTEDGSESFNLFDHNFALRGIGEPNDSVSEARTAMGTEGVGFWFRGPNNYVTNNVAANFQNPTTEAAYGFVYQQIRLGTIKVPNFKGADTSVTGQYTSMNGNGLPIPKFENNEAYGAMQGGFTYWWVSSLDPQPVSGGQPSIIKNLKLWHIYNKVIYHYPAQMIVFDGLKIRGNYNVNNHCCGDGVYFPDYSAKGIVIRNSDIQGMDTGIDAPVGGFGPEPNLIVENTYLRNRENMNVGTNWSVNGCWMQNKMVQTRNTRFDPLPGGSLLAITMGRSNSNGVECLSVLDEVRVYGYNGNSSDNFQVYHSNTAVLPRPPASCTPTTRTGFNNALLCPIAPLVGTTAPSAPQNLRIIK